MRANLLFWKLWGQSRKVSKMRDWLCRKLRVSNNGSEEPWDSKRSNHWNPNCSICRSRSNLCPFSPTQANRPIWRSLCARCEDLGHACNFSSSGIRERQSDQGVIREACDSSASIYPLICEEQSDRWMKMECSIRTLSARTAAFRNRIWVCLIEFIPYILLQISW